MLFKLTSDGNTVVQDSTYIPKILGSNQATGRGGKIMA
jgi:hypothetical protein